eukprot:3244461-Alexandrium_andersonii.AAC.1
MARPSGVAPLSPVQAPRARVPCGGRRQRGAPANCNPRGSCNLGQSFNREVGCWNHLAYSELRGVPWPPVP